MSESFSTKDLKRVLTRKDLMGIAVGQIIGAGIMSLTGIAIGYAGKAVIFAFLLSALFTIFMLIPHIFVGGTIRMRGGGYTQAALFVNEKFAGIYIIIYVVSNLSIAMYALSFADYMLALVPGLNKTLISFLILTLFYVVNLLGIQGAAKIQNIMVLILAAALTLFIGFGITEIQPGYFNDPNFMVNGLGGFFTATAILSFATGGAQVIVNFGAEAKNPTKDIPFVIIVSTLCVAAIYALMSVVAAGVLPVEEVAFKPLDLVAKEIMPAPVYVFFIVGGAMFSLSTTLNATLGWVTKPLLQACVDGWFPKKLGAINNKYKTPHWLLTIFYIIGLIPIFTGLDIEFIANMALVLIFITTIINTIGVMRMPKILPKEWNNSRFKIPNGLFNFLMILASLCVAFQCYILAKQQPKWLLIANVILFILAYIYATLRIKNGKVNMEISYEEM